MEDIKNRFEFFLKSKDLKQSEFSRITNYPPKKISGFLTGGVKTPKIDLMVALATHFPEFNLRWLLLGEGEMINPKTIEINSNSIQLLITRQEEILKCVKQTNNKHNQ